ncbi:hypothetical protein CJ739_56 [Mariniflexile rhizosphaerae]|uniref:hypothetical protein n=1 Tax=unclassified Mariniflexile TaxID=2643887 RepID=UPI000E330CD0|nr:hypothetical protein [Mariniflexile sp. TRM1-10]AXP79156.1 hypothetical protein CJ739_56 [Mariniflexile sp. TRM1-10]
MPYNIILHKAKKFSTGPGTPLVNDWVFVPSSGVEKNYVIGGALPGNLNIDTFIKNYLLTGSYGKVIVRAKINTPGQVGNLNWATLSGPIAAATPAEPIGITDKTGYELTNLNLNVTNTVSFINTQLLTEGAYFGVIEFLVYNASDSLIQPVQIGAAVFSFVLNVMSQPLLSVTPTALVFSMIRNGALPASQNINITAGSSWIASTDKKVTLSEASTVDNSSATQTIITGTSNKTVSVGIASEINGFAGNKFETVIVIKEPVGTTRSVSVTVNILETDIFTITPKSLLFEAVKGFTEADAQAFQVSGFGAFTLTAPTWLNLSAYSGVSSGTFIATPISANNLSSKTYTGEIVLKTNVAEYILPVTYIVHGSVSTNLQSNNFNFTKDIEYINIRNANRDDENVVRLTLDVKVYSYLSHAETLLSYTYFLPFFEYNASFHIGEVIERLLKKPSKITDFNLENLDPEINFYPVYKPASVNAKIEIIKRSTAAVILTENLDYLLFVNGKKPASFISNGAILSNSKSIKRVTKTSRELLNFLVPAGGFEIKIQKNKEASETIASRNTDGHNIFQYYFDFAAYNPADVITLSVLSQGNVFKKSYQLITEGDYSNHIAFINQFNTLEVLELLGGYSLQSDIKKITHKYYKDLIEHIETLESTKDLRLLINTGNIFKEDQVVIDEMLRSKKAWLIFPDKPAIELIPLDKKLTNFDSDQELYDFELEFHINRQHDVENYTF